MTDRTGAFRALIIARDRLCDIEATWLMMQETVVPDLRKHGQTEAAEALAALCTSSLKDERELSRRLTAATRHVHEAIVGRGPTELRPAGSVQDVRDVLGAESSDSHRISCIVYTKKKKKRKE